MTNRRRHANQRNTKKAPAKKAQPPARRSTAPAERPVQTQLPLPVQFEMTATVEQFTGPLPPPAVLSEYDRIVPGLAAEIVEMAHDEQRFRHRIVETAVDANVASDKRGQLFALAIAILGLVAAVACALINQPAVAAVIGGGSLATIVGLFLKRQLSDKAEDS